MKKNFKSNLLLGILLLVLAAAFIYGMAQLFDHSEYCRVLFCGESAGNGVIGRVDPASQQTLAARVELAGRISMYIFAVVTAMQFLAFFLALTVLRRIKRNAVAPEFKLRQLEGADIFFDVPLYIGLFGTVSSFLVMTFSPQSARLIAYSSTLIGIIFSLALRVTLLFPFRQKLLNLTAGVEK